MNVLYPAYLDDWYYSFNFGLSYERISSFYDIINSQYQHYFEWGGRSVVHSIAHLLLWVGEPWNNILNTVAYLALVMLIYTIANQKKEARPLLFLLINILIWFTLPAFSQNLLWITGSANYLWGSLIVFAIISFYVSYYLNSNMRDNIIRKISFFFLGIFAGWTNENMSVALIFFIIAIILLLKLQKKPIPRWMFFGLIGAIIGTILLLAAPGNHIRAQQEFVAIHNMQGASLSYYFYRLVTVTRMARIHLSYPILLYIILLGIYIYKNRKQQKKEIIYLSVLFFITSLVATAAMAGSPSFPGRAWFGIIMLMLTAIAILFANIDFSSFGKLKIPYYLAFLVAGVLFILSCQMNYIELKHFSETCKRRERLIDEKIKKGEEDIIINDKIFVAGDSRLIILNLYDWLIDDPEHWSKLYGRYKNVKTIKIYDSSPKEQ
nr:DUF6056 family protein [Dysgonomonas sp. 511]